MFHLDRRKAVRGQAVTVLLAVLSFTMAGAGLGFWLGKYADLASLTIDRSTDLALAPPAVVTAPSIKKSAVPDEVDLIAERVGEMQAELMRLNALGERLVEMAGLDPAEFDFTAPPPQGGPETGAVRDYTIKELASELGSVVAFVQDRQRKLEVLENVIVERDLAAQAFPSGWPVRSGYISSRYGFRIHPVKRVRIFHEGIDLASPNGTPIFASADGVVTFSGRKGGYGRLVEIRHADGLVTRYGHNSSNLVREGDMIRQGQKIATVGSSGTATGPHVHFEVLKNGRPVNPMPYLGARPRQLMAKSSPRLPG